MVLFGGLWTTANAFRDYYDDNGNAHPTENTRLHNVSSTGSDARPNHSRNEQNMTSNANGFLFGRSIAEDRSLTFESTGIQTNHSSSNSLSNSSHKRELPSLTAAFQSLENRPIIVNCMIYIAIYFIIAVVAYSYVFERWTIIDSLYFAAATFSTCGYGDKEPTTTPGQIFTIVFAIYGVTILGIFIGIFGSFISNTQTKAMKQFQSKKQNQMIDTIFGVHSESTNHSSKSNSEKLIDENDDDVIDQTGFWSDHISLADDIWRVIRSEFPAIALVAVMALILGLREGWSVTSIAYFSIMAATTTGYGDYTPTNQLNKLYCVILYPLAVAVFGEVLGRIATVYIQRKQRVAQSKFLQRSLTLCDIRNMDSDDDGKVTREDFILFMLVAIQKVDRSTIDQLKSNFNSLDTNGNGYLEEADLTDLAEENYIPTLQRIHKQFTEVVRVGIFPRGRTTAAPDGNCHRRAHTIL